jgi:hypothetical protein
MPRTTQLIVSGKIEIKETGFLSKGADKAIAEVKHARVCDINLALFQGDYPVPLAHVCGHEFTERVKRNIGDGIDKKLVGKTVKGIINHDGAFADEVKVPPRSMENRNEYGFTILKF